MRALFMAFGVHMSRLDIDRAKLIIHNFEL